MSESNKSSSRPVQRLVVELGSRAQGDLEAICAIEEINKTTATNRAIQLYRMVIDAQRAGKKIGLVQGDQVELIYVL